MPLQSPVFPNQTAQHFAGLGMDVQLFRHGDLLTLVMQFDKTKAIEGLHGAGNGEGRTDEEETQEFRGFGGKGCN